MNHSDVRSRLGDYLEGDLSLADRALVDAHLDECADCASELRGLRATVRLMRGLPDPTPPPGLAARVMGRIEDGEGRPRWFDALRVPSLGFGARLGSALAASAAVALMVWVNLDAPLPESAMTPAEPERAYREQSRPRLRLENVGTSLKQETADEAFAASPSPPAGLAEADAAAEIAPDPELERLLRDPDAFAAGLAGLPSDERTQRMTRLAQSARGSGRASEAASALRAADSPAARALAPHFEE